MALEGGEGSASCPGHSLPPGKTRYPLYRRLGGPQGRSGQVQKISLPPGFDPWTVQPVVSRYTEYAMWSTLFLRGNDISKTGSASFHFRVKGRGYAYLPLQLQITNGFNLCNSMFSLEYYIKVTSNKSVILGAIQSLKLFRIYYKGILFFLQNHANGGPLITLTPSSSSSSGPGAYAPDALQPIRLLCDPDLHPPMV